MPELPDVEVFKQYVDSTSLYQKISKVKVHSPEMLDKNSVEDFKQKLTGREFQATMRHGKYLFLRLDSGQSLVLHFGMTGFPAYFLNEDEAPSHIRMRITFTNNYHLAYDCQRKLGLFDIIDSEENFIQEKELGADPYRSDFNFNNFKAIMQNQRGSLKSALMNQKRFAGIGNIYSDEIMFQAGLHPKTPANSLDEKQLKTVYEKMNDVFQRGIKSLSSHEPFPDDFLIPNRKPDDKCPKCRGTIVKETISGRSSYFCPQHQK